VKRTLILAIVVATASAHAQIAPQRLASHIRFLADDALEGRETGTRGYELAAQYVAAQFGAAGVEALPGGWYQPLALRAGTVDEEPSSIAINGRRLVSRKDFVLRPYFFQEHTSIEAGAVFAGFGIVAPELKHDDFANVDVRGRIVVMLSGAPPSFPTDQRAIYSDSARKQRNAAARGAAGVLTLQTITDEARYPFSKRAAQIGITPMAYLHDGKPQQPVEAIRGGALISREAADVVFAGAPMTAQQVLADAEKSIAHSFALPARVSITTATKFAEARSENVVGVVWGGDPKLRHEYVVVSAHLDHLGNHPPPGGGDAIYNGAYDNGSGIAALIEIAREVARGPRPKRSVLFVAFTAEEKGEQGSDFFARFPPVPKGSIVADVNMDMFLMIYPIADLVPLGGEHSSLGAMAADAARAAGLSISPDPYPEEVRFVRSDQYSFVKEGIPAIHLKTGNKSSDPNVNGEKLTREWLRNVYHTPKDDLSQPFDFASGAKYAETNLRLVRAIANAPQRPRWKKGDLFATLFGK
jgi:Zn-dependent M28 family amino/carboxypeptidase